MDAHKPRKLDYRTAARLLVADYEWGREEADSYYLREIWSPEAYEVYLAILDHHPDAIQLALLWRAGGKYEVMRIAARNAPSTTAEIVDIERVADLLTVSKETVARLTKNGEIPSYRIGDRLVRYDLDEIREYLRRNAQ